MQHQLFPHGVFVAHLERKECILFQIHATCLIDFASTGLDLLKNRLVLGLALSDGAVYVIQYGKHKRHYKEALLM